MADALFLCGMPGSGKSTLGKRLAARLHWGFVDLDAYIARVSGLSASQWIEMHGEAAFRKTEAECLRKLAEQTEPHIIACGGGTPCFEGNLEYMQQQGVVVRIDLPLATLIQRLAQGKGKRPLLSGASLDAKVEEVWEARKDVYLSINNVLQPLKQSEIEMAEQCRIWLL